MELLEKLIRSIPVKDNIQIIVIDDNSNEDINDLKNKNTNFTFNHILFLKNNTSKKGAGTCRNIGLNHAEGKWILFADSDDFFLEDFYSKIEKYFNSKNDVVYFTPTSIDIKTQKESDRHLKYKSLIYDYLNSGNLHSEIRLRYQFMVPWSKLIKRSFLEKFNIKFDEVIASNDVMFSTRVGYFMEKYEVTKEIVYCVTRGPGTLTTNIDEKIYNARFETFVNYCNFLQENVAKETIKILNLNGLGVLVEAHRNNLGFNRIIRLYCKLKKNNIKVLNKKILNPIYLVKNGKSYYKRLKSKNKHSVK